MFKRNGRQEYVHRHVYESTKAKLRRNYDVHHVCGVRNCYNPDHLEQRPKDRHRIAALQDARRRFASSRPSR